MTARPPSRARPERQAPSAHHHPARRAARWAMLGVALVVGASALSASVAIGATKSIAGRGMVQETNTVTKRIDADVLLTEPADAALTDAVVTLKVVGSAKIYKHVGQTAIGGTEKAPRQERVALSKVLVGDEVIFFGRYTPGTRTVAVTRVHLTDRAFAACGTFKSITRRSARNVGEDRLTVEPKQVTVQESRYARLLPKQTDVVFAFHGSTKFSNASGTLAKPRNRTSIVAEDVTASNQTIGLRGKVTGGSVLEVDTVDLDIKCP